MRIGILGTGVVGKTLGGSSRSLSRGAHGSARRRREGKGLVKDTAANRLKGTFADAAAHAETSSTAARAQCRSTPKGSRRTDLQRKILVDVSNRSISSKGMPPALSSAIQIRSASRSSVHFPTAKVVKSLTHGDRRVMVRAVLIPGVHTMFVSGNDAKCEGGGNQPPQTGFGWKESWHGDITGRARPRDVSPVGLRSSRAQDSELNIHVAF